MSRHVDSKTESVELRRHSGDSLLRRGVEPRGEGLFEFDGDAALGHGAMIIQSAFQSRAPVHDLAE